MTQQLGKISSKGQVTIPVNVRNALQVKAGDTLAWEIETDGRIYVRRMEAIDFAYLNSISGTLSEWDSVEDDEAYRDL